MAILANYIGVDAFLNGASCGLQLWEEIGVPVAQLSKVRYRMQRTARTWLVLALCLWAALLQDPALTAVWCNCLPVECGVWTVSHLFV